MKKTVICLTVLLLLLVPLCSCSLLSGAEEATTEAVTGTADTTPTEPPVRKSWGAPFTAEGTQEQIAYQFISSVFPETWKSSFSCEMTLDVTKWGLRESTAEDQIEVYLTFAAKADAPTEADAARLREGNAQQGKDEYEGYMLLTRYCYLQKQADGSWQCVDFGLSW